MRNAINKFFNDNKKENFKTQEKRKLRDYIVSYCMKNVITVYF